MTDEPVVYDGSTGLRKLPPVPVEERGTSRDHSLSFGERLTLLRAEKGIPDPDESRSQNPRRPAVVSPPANESASWLDPSGDNFGLRGIFSGLANAVNEACDSIGIREIYEALSKGKYGARSGDEQMISCPNPEHPDLNPSASMNESLDLFACYRCYAPGTDKYAIAAYAWGYPVPVGRSLWEIKKRLARELRQVDVVDPSREVRVQSAKTVEPEPPPQDDRATYEVQVQAQMQRRLIYLEADQRARQQRSAGLFTAPASVDDLESELLEPDPAIEWSVENLHSVGGNTTITAGFKVGKTTLVMNLVKALADGSPFLGEHEVRELSGRIAYWNFEVEEIQMRRTFREMDIKNASRIWHQPLRGVRLDLMDDAAYEWTVNEMRRREIEAWILDPYSGVYCGDENDNSQINEFLKRLDQLKRDAGISDLYMPAHTGRVVEEGNERARGGAKLDDWTDNRWILSKHPSAGTRFFKAEGRRVSQEERELLFRRDDIGLTYSGFTGTRKQRTRSATREDILAFLTSHPGSSGRQINEAVEARDTTVRATVTKLVADFEVETRPGTGNTVEHYIFGTAPI